METYHKIQTLFKRHLDGPKKGKMIRGDWTTQELEYLADNRWEFTEKVDGTNIRVHLTRKGDVFEVAYAGRTDNAILPGPLSQTLETIFDNGNVYAWMLDSGLDEVLLFGEGYGPKIQNGGNYRDDQSFVLFDVKIGDFWLTRENVNDIAAKLGIDAVPVLGYGTLHDAIDIVSSGLTWDSSGKMTNWGYGGGQSNAGKFNGLKSQWGNFEAEGIVARPVVPLFNRKGERIITKIKAVDFK